MLRIEAMHMARFECLVAMPDHIHIILQLIGDIGLPVVMNRLKGVSSRAINLALSRQGPVWQRAYHDRALRDDQALTAAMRYAWHNPVAAGIVSHPREYPYWWSAGALTNLTNFTGGC